MATADEWSGRREGLETASRAQGQRYSAGKRQSLGAICSTPYWFVRLHVRLQPPHLARSPDPSAHRSAGGNCGAQSVRRAARPCGPQRSSCAEGRTARGPTIRNALPFLLPLRAPSSPRSVAVWCVEAAQTKGKNRRETSGAFLAHFFSFFSCFLLRFPDTPHSHDNGETSCMLMRSESGMQAMGCVRDSCLRGPSGRVEGKAAAAISLVRSNFHGDERATRALTPSITSLAARRWMGCAG